MIIQVQKHKQITCCAFLRSFIVQIQGVFYRVPEFLYAMIAIQISLHGSLHRLQERLFIYADNCGTGIHL